MKHEQLFFLSDSGQSGWSSYQNEELLVDSLREITKQIDNKKGIFFLLFYEFAFKISYLTFDAISRPYYKTRLLSLCVAFKL